MIAKNITKQDHLDVHVYPRFNAMFCILDPQKYNRVNIARQPNEKAKKIGFLSVPSTKTVKFIKTKNMFF